MRTLDINAIIDHNSLAVWFQPIVSVRRQSILLLEALSRGIDPASGEIIPPLELFAAAMKAGKQGNLEHLCVKRALDNFSRIRHIFPFTLLSLNIGNELLDHLDDPNWLCEMLDELDISPHRVIIEVLESALAHKQTYRSFMQACRAGGILLAIDDVGAQYSGLMRIIEVKPDLIKIDRDLICGIHHEKWQLEVVRALTVLAHHTGAQVVAEGIEQEEEALACLQLGIDLQQGFLFSRAHAFDNQQQDHGCLEAIRRVAESYRQRSCDVHQTRRDLLQNNMREINQIYDELVKLNYSDLEPALYWLIDKHRRLQFIYVLNSLGITVTDTVGRSDSMMDHRQYIFRPARKGEDLSLKDYFLSLQAGLTRHVSEPYISSATGSECITYSIRFTTADGIPCVLCVDMDACFPVQSAKRSDGQTEKCV